MANSLNTTNPSRRAILTGIPAAAIGIGAVSASAMALNEDAELCALREPLMRAWDAEKALYPVKGLSDEEFDAAVIRTSEIVQEILALEAHSIEGLKVKATALSWTYSGQAFDIDDFAEDSTTDMRLIHSIVACALQLAGCEPFRLLPVTETNI
jgi:hypothetical protein